MTPEIVTLDGVTQLRILDDNGVEMLIPANFLPALASRAGLLSSVLVRTLDEARKEEHHPKQRHELVPGNAGNLKVLTLPNADAEADSTPYLHWNAETSQRTHGWSLSITGIDNASLGFAAWNDTAAQDSLVEMLTDVESCITIAAITAPEATARMTARLSARALRSARALPGIDLGKARKIITDAGLATPESISGYSAARARLLTISSGERKVPVAVAVAPPSRFEDMREISSEEAQKMSWQDRSKLQAEYLEEKRTPWIANAKRAFTDAGWRVLDLQIDGRGNSNVFFATRIDAETWSSISAAAQASARVLGMNRGGRI
jgi:hypothetical protein